MKINKCSKGCNFFVIDIVVGAGILLDGKKFSDIREIKMPTKIL